MKSHIEYILGLKSEGKLAEIRDTWVSLGSLTVTPKTKLYVKDTIFQVILPPYNPAITPSDLFNALVYCSADYKVDNVDFMTIDWDSASVTSTEGLCSVVEGVTSPHFRVLLTREEMASVSTIPINEDYMPYQFKAGDSDLVIDDSELEIILGEVGVPFLRMEELEYTRDAILNTCLKPALQEYYKFFPISDQRELGNVGCNAEYKFELPPYCYAVTRAWVAQASGGGSSGSIPPGAYNFMAQTMGGTGMGGGGNFGRGVNYRGKRVPGYVGGTDAMSAFLMQRAANQAMVNYAKREKFRYIRQGKKIYIAGFSSIGGILCANFAFWSPNWDDIQFERLNEVRKLSTSYVLQNLGMLRALVKTDVPGNIDYSLYTNRAKDLKDEVLSFWKTLPTNFATVQRG